MTSKQQDPQPSDNGQGPLEADSFITKDTAPWREFPASPIDSDRAGLVRAWSDTTKCIRDDDFHNRSITLNLLQVIV